MAATSESRKICKVCQQQWSKYVCPRCNLQYCSLDCYKKHGQQCTESFYRQNVTEHLESVQTSAKERQHILAILQRIQQEDASDLATHQDSNDESEDPDEDELELSENLMQKLDLVEGPDDFDISEADLTHKELQAFKHAVASGKLNNMVQIWTPWWNLPEAATIQLSASGTNRVSVQDQDTGEAANAVRSLPAAPSQPLPLLASLTKVSPSPLVQWQLLDILYAYCFVMRLYNGDCSSDPQEATMTILQVSATLEAASASPAAKSQQHSSSRHSALPKAAPLSASEALSKCAERVCSPAVAGCGGHFTAIGLLQDVAALVQHGRSAVVLVLNDLNRLFSESQGVFLPSRTPAKTDKQTVHVRQIQGCIQDPSGKSSSSRRDTAAAQKQVKCVLRKLCFLLSWANELPQAAYAGLLQCVVEELQQHASVPPVSQDADEIKLSPFAESTLLHRHDVVQSSTSKPLVIEEL